jgi:hypothetical protein
MLLKCETFGTPEGPRAIVLASEAQTVFDGIISEFVSSTGIPGRSAA